MRPEKSSPPGNACQARRKGYRLVIKKRVHLGAPPQRLKSGRDILGSSDFKRKDLDAHRAGRYMDLVHLQHSTATANICQNRQPLETRQDLTQEFEAFASKVGEL
jgi:hypothetical protein